MARAEVEALLAEHRPHRAGERREARRREHVELELAVPVDELGVGEEVDPVVHVDVEGAEQPAVLPGAPLEELARLDLSGFAEVVDEQVAHLPAVAHLLDHDAADAVGVVVRGGGLQQVALLLDGRELRVALVDDQVQQRVPDGLVGDLREALPLALAGEVPVLDLVGLQVAVLGLEGVVGVLRQLEADVVLPRPEGVDPVVEGRDLLHEAPETLIISTLCRSRSTGRASSSRSRTAPGRSRISSTARPATSSRSWSGTRRGTRSFRADPRYAALPWDQGERSARRPRRLRGALRRREVPPRSDRGAFRRRPGGRLPQGPPPPPQGGGALLPVQGEARPGEGGRVAPVAGGRAVVRADRSTPKRSGTWKSGGSASVGDHALNSSSAPRSIR